MATDRRIDKIIGLFAEYRLFYRSLLQKRPIILSILLTIASPSIYPHESPIYVPKSAVSPQKKKNLLRTFFIFCGYKILHLLRRFFFFCGCFLLRRYGALWHIHMYMGLSCGYMDGEAIVSRIDKIIGLFCKRDL